MLDLEFVKTFKEGYKTLIFFKNYNLRIVRISSLTKYIVQKEKDNYYVKLFLNESLNEYKFIKNFSSVNIIKGKKLNYEDLSYLFLPLYSQDLPKINKKYLLSLIKILKLLSKKNIVHNDIKKDNFVYDEKKDRLILIDFSVSFFKKEKSNKDPNSTSKLILKLLCEKYGVSFNIRNINIKKIKKELEKITKKDFSLFFEVVNLLNSEKNIDLNHIREIVKRKEFRV